MVNYWRNDRFRRKLRMIFESWRGVTHEWFKERLDNEKGKFRQELEGRLLVQWREKVDGQVLYMAQLEEKIKNEVEAREKLAQTYERSLNSGVHQLNSETQMLAENPLVREISLIVANELIKKGQTNGELADLLRQRSRDQDLLNEVFK